jgi:hypothetical protein
MTDFYPLLVQAVSKLSVENPQARQELYDHARKFLITQLSGQKPNASAPEIMREQIALETAIRKVESQSGQARRPNGREPPSANSASLVSLTTIRQLDVVADHEWPDINFDRKESQSEISAWPRAASQSGFSAQATLSPTMAIIGHISETLDGEPAKLKNGSNEKISPRDLNNGRSINVGLPRQDLKSQPTDASKRRKKSKSISESEEDFASKKFALFDPKIIGLAAIAVVLTFIAVISIPLVTIYFSRLVWFFEHLIAN